MNHRGRFRPSPAFVLAAIALFVALGGTAAGLADKNTVDSGDIINRAVHSRDIGKGAVRATNIGEGQVQSADVLDDTEPGGGLSALDIANAASGSDAIDADTLDGLDWRSLFGQVRTYVGPPTAIPDSENGAAAVSCAPGELPIGGGGFFEANGAGYIYSSRPAVGGSPADDGAEPDGWRVGAHNNQPEPLNLYAQVVCLKLEG
jgi:hypothetical protein